MRGNQEIEDHPAAATPRVWRHSRILPRAQSLRTATSGSMVALWQPLCHAAPQCAAFMPDPTCWSVHARIIPDHTCRSVNALDTPSIFQAVDSTSMHCLRMPEPSCPSFRIATHYPWLAKYAAMHPAPHQCGVAFLSNIICF